MSSGDWGEPSQPAGPDHSSVHIEGGTQPHMVRTGLFMNEDGKAFSARMTCEEELGRLLGDRKNEPFVPPAFINVRCAENVSLSHSVVVGMRAKARLLCKSNQVALPRIGIPPCVQAPWRRAAARKPRAGCGPGE